MNHDRQIQIGGQPAVSAERALLQRPRLMVAVEIQAAFANRPHAAIAGQLAERRNRRRVEACAVMWMHANRGVPAVNVMAHRDRPPCRGKVGRHHQHLIHAIGCGTLAHVVEVVGKPRIGQMRVTVEQPGYPSRRGNSGGPPGTS